MDDVSANPESGSDSTSAPDPVAMIEGLLEREHEPAPTKKPRDQKPDPEPEQPEQPEQPEPGPETPPEEGEDAEDDAEAPQEQEPEPETFTVRVDGKEVAVTRDELLAGYSRQADYSRKTAELAEQRRAAEAEIQRVAAERQHYAQQLDQVAAVLQHTLPPPPPPEMLDTDPIGYVQQKEHYEARVGQLRKVLAERDEAQQLSQKQMQQQQQQMLEAARAQLAEMLPEWREEKTAAKEKPAVVKHLQVIGYTDAEIGQAADPRALVMARESMLYRQLMASKPQVQQRVAAAPKMVRPGSTGPAPDKTKAVIQQVRRSGGKDLDAVARLIEMG